VAFLRPRSPELSEAISSISPSLAAQLELCALAVVFSRDTAYRDLSRRGSHFAALGEICHTLWEREGRGDFDGLPDDAINAALNEAWEDAERRSLHELRESLGGAQPPPPRQWPGYLTKRLGAIALVRRSIQERREQPERVAGSFRPSVEESIDLAGRHLRGRPDRVVWRSGAPHIIDLKTCAAGHAMRLEHRRQLLAYAYMFHAKNDIWPRTASIQYVGGESRTFDVDPTEAEEAVAEMLAALKRLNDFQGAAEELAQPSEEACRWCEFKVACEPFYSAVDETWDLGNRDVLGTVGEIDSVAGRASLTLEGGEGNVAGEPIVAVASDARFFEGINLGDYVAIAHASPTRSPTTIRCNWDSVACVWRQGTAAGRPEIRSRLP
jgi:hypothetical protein